MTRINNNFHDLKSIISHNLEPDDFEPHRSKRPRKETNLGSDLYTYILVILHIIMERRNLQILPYGKKPLIVR